MQQQLRLQILIIFLIILLHALIDAKSVIEPCSSSQSCISLLFYNIPFDSKLSEIAFRFRVNYSDVLAANSLNPKTLTDQIFHTGSVLKVPISCPCVDGIRRSVLTAYSVRVADTLDSISDAFGGLVSAEQIGSTNGVNDKNRPLMIGQSLVIPLPCTCFDSVNNGIAAVYMSYVVQSGESLAAIGAKFGITVANLEAVNGLGQPVVDPGDIISIPISACSSANLNWYYESLIVPNGSYALTASNCIECVCGPEDLNLRCSPSGLPPSCSYLQCKGSVLFIGESDVTHTAIGCNITTCVYRGHNGGKIFRSLANASNVFCPGSHNDPPSPRASPALPYPLGPSIALSPSPSPASSPAWNGPDGTISSIIPTSGQSFSFSGDGRLLVGRRVLSYSLLLMELVMSLVF